MKYTGAALLWIAFTLTGMRVSSLLNKRITVLDETVIFLNSLSTEIEFSKMNIFKILCDISSEPTVRSLSYLCCFSSDNNTDFHRQWKDSISSFIYYRREEKQKMLQLGSFLGTTDAENQIKTIKLYLSFFENYRSKAYNDYEKYGKASSLFGLFAGASVFILLI